MWSFLGRLTELASDVRRKPAESGLYSCLGRDRVCDHILMEPAKCGHVRDLDGLNKADPIPNKADTSVLVGMSLDSIRDDFKHFIL